MHPLFIESTMKSKVWILLSLSISLIACKKLDQAISFNMRFNHSVVIPSSTGVNLPFNVFTPDVESNSEATFEVNNTRKNLIDRISLEEMDLSLVSPSNADFSFLESIEIFIQAEGLDEQRVAWLDEVSETAGNSISLNTTGVDLQAYIKKDEFSLRVNTVTDELITSDHQIDIASRFLVEAKLFGD